MPIPVKTTFTGSPAQAIWFGGSSMAAPALTVTSMVLLDVQALSSVAVNVYVFVPNGAPVTVVVRLFGLVMVPGPDHSVPITAVGSVKVALRVKGSPEHTGVGFTIRSAGEPSQQVMVRLEKVISSLPAQVWV